MPIYIIFNFCQFCDFSASPKQILKKWKKVNRTMKKKEKALNEAMENLDYVNKLKGIKTLNDVFLNKKLFNTVIKIKSLVALRRLITCSLESFFP